MNERTLRVLELDKIKAKLADLVSSSLGRELAEDLAVSTNKTEVALLLKETSEAREIYRTEEFPLKGLTDVRSAVRRCGLGAIVGPEELFAVAVVLGVARKVSRFFADRQDKYPLLAEHAEAIVSLKGVEDEIRSCIGESGEVLDNASDKLRKLRIGVRGAQSDVRAKLDSMVRSSVTQKYLQENLVTMRNDRYVLPVKAEYRGQIPGIIHDQSASGATLFIEPMAVMEINNKLRQLMVQELQEVERILQELGALIGNHAEDITGSLGALGQLDLCLAKGKLSWNLRCVEPDLNDQYYLRFKAARHPLINPEEVRPINVHLGRDFSVVLITGPNTGGKTVTLKTVGLLSLMVQCGLHIPVGEGSEACVFENIYADIGDEQSIEQSLSTFSSHMTNIRRIVDEADETSLVLLDELGAGTDPTEGAALAMAIIDTLFERGTRIVATTHYSELKAYAHTKPGVQNASMEFDVETLRPTYHLTIGLPGKSNAFEISQRLGLDLNVIDRARKYLSGEVLKVEDLIRGLEVSRKETDEARNEAFLLRRNAEILARDTQDKAQRLQEKEVETLRKATVDARALINRAKHEVDALVEELRKAQEAKSAEEISHVIERVRQGWRDLSKGLSKEETVEPVLPATNAQEIEAGDEVFVIHLNQRGKVLELTSGSAVTVQLGSLRLSTELRNLRKVEPKKKVDRGLRTGFHMVDLSRKGVGLELDLRGHTVEEGVLKTDKYLDDAIVAGLNKVHIIHGKGTGALREGIRDYLKNHPQVKSHRLGQANEGGSGVTVVEFKQG